MSKKRESQKEQSHTKARSEKIIERRRKCCVGAISRPRHSFGGFILSPLVRGALTGSGGLHRGARGL